MALIFVRQDSWIAFGNSMVTFEGFLQLSHIRDLLFVTEFS